jgi:hypothetical protein
LRLLENGGGKDLDVFMVPQTNDANLDGLLQALRTRMKAVAEPVPGDWNRILAPVITQTKQAIDLQFIWFA